MSKSNPFLGTHPPSPPILPARLIADAKIVFLCSIEETIYIFVKDLDTLVKWDYTGGMEFKIKKLQNLQIS